MGYFPQDLACVLCVPVIEIHTLSKRYPHFKHTAFTTKDVRVQE